MQISRYGVLLVFVLGMCVVGSGPSWAAARVTSGVTSGAIFSVEGVPFLSAASGDGMPLPPGQGTAENSGSDGTIMDSLLAGSFIGSLLGYPFEGLGVPDLIAGTLLIFIALKLFLTFWLSSTRQEENTPPSLFGGGEKPGEGTPERRSLPTIQERAASAWDSLRSTPAADYSAGHATLTAPSAHVPQGFDPVDFLEGAKLLYTRLQVAWAARNIEGLRNFITPEMLAVLEEQGAAHPETSKLDVMLITPTLLDVTREGPEERAKVLFNALLQEGEGAQAQTFEVKEIWYFTHDYETGTTWQLDGIEQVAGDA